MLASILLLISGCSSLALLTAKNTPAPPATLSSKDTLITYPEERELVNSFIIIEQPSVADLEPPLDLSFEFALKEYLNDSALKAQPLLPQKYELFSFAEHLLSLEDSHLFENEEVLSTKPPLLSKSKKGESKTPIREESFDSVEIRPYYFSLNELKEENKPSLDSSSAATYEPDLFTLKNSSAELSKPQSKENEEKSASDQISSIVSLFPSVLHEKVKDFINYFQNKADSFFSKALARSQAYEQMMKSIFREKNLPEELFYLALIESGFNPFAVSRKKASGIWQFVAKTANRFGLRVDKWVDERRDPEKSTYAAAEYLKQLYEMFNCWELATAAYNAGEGKILKAMQKTKGQNFWEIAQDRYLKPETKKYVPKFLAALLIAKEPEKYGFSNIPYHPPFIYEKIIVPPSTSLAWIAKVSETDLAELRALNPSLKLDKTPPQGEFEIRLPLGKKEVFEKNIAIQQKLASSGNKKHRVRYGETLARIARQYRVNVDQLCQINGLHPKDKIKPGLILILPP